jgi:hypothetical protein
MSTTDSGTSLPLFDRFRNQVTRLVRSQKCVKLDLITKQRGGKDGTKETDLEKNQRNSAFEMGIRIE